MINHRSLISGDPLRGQLSRVAELAMPVHTVCTVSTPYYGVHSVESTVWILHEPLVTGGSSVATISLIAHVAGTSWRLLAEGPCNLQRQIKTLSFTSD